MAAPFERRLPKGWGDLFLQLGIWFGFFGIYQIARGIADRSPSEAFSNGQSVIDIQRALQARMRNEPAPEATGDPSPGGGTSTTPTKPPKNQTTTDVSEPKNENPPEASGQVDSDSASSVPIPLLVLAGLALLLIAGGSAGYFIRRYQGRNNPPPAV